MKKFIIILLLLPFSLHAQLFDDFADGNFTQNPEWLGDTASFKISTYSSSSWSVQPRLQLNGSAADTSFLYTPNIMANLDDKQWDIWIRLAFNTSASNNCKIYIVSDNSNLNGPLNGYFIMLGDDNNDQNDSICLYKQSGSTITKLIQGHNAFTGASANYRIKATRDAAGNWELLSDATGGHNFVSEGTATDLSFNNSSYFGIYCKYTSTNKTNFYFDDIYSGPVIVDTIAPYITSAYALSSTTLDVSFSEIVSTSTSENISNYSVTGIGNPVSAVRDAVNGSIVHLSFSMPFTEGVLYNLNVSNIADLTGNIMLPATVPFSWYYTQTYDVLINEIMADPDPPVGLPNYEYLELYNRTPVPINLKNWELQIGTTIKTFPDVTIQAGGFLILAADAAGPSLAPYGPFTGFSTFSLTNSGASLLLKNQNGDIIHFIDYSDTWYRDNTKINGGWSLEQIDPDNPCGEAFNWKASTGSLGGTPGNQNSVFSLNPDTLNPFIKEVHPLTLTTAEVFFNETVTAEAIANPSNYFIDNSIGFATGVVITGTSFKSVVLSLPDSLQQDVIYTLTFTDTLFDCSGNYTVTTSKIFSIYHAKVFDLVFNEIMADPDPAVGLPAYEYAELYNRTDFPISLAGWELNISGTAKEIGNASIEPHSYLILSSSGSEVSWNAYGSVAEISGFSLTNENGYLILNDSSGHTISFVNYSLDWYGSSSKKDGGWSLEQIDPGNPCGEASNWKPSVAIAGGTPGSVNSVNSVNPDLIQPRMIRAAMSRFDKNNVRVYFNEPLDSVSLKKTTRYVVDNNVGAPDEVRAVIPDNKSLVLHFPQVFSEGIIYTLTVSDSILDCSGNMILQNSSVRFAIPEMPDSADIVVNEVLFDPLEGGVDYVEVYNRSQKVLDFFDLNLSGYDAGLNDVKSITEFNYLFFPGTYICLSTSQSKVKSQYNTPNPYGFLDMLSFPSFNTDEGSVVISTKNEEIIDAMSYTSDMHFPLLNTTDGVSLERIDFNRPASDLTNWHSAAETLGFGTPAYQNSQFLQSDADDGVVAVYPEIFSPDNDGYNDLLNITVSQNGTGRYINITIYDSKGRLVKYLVKNVLIADENTFTWDGTNDRRQKADMGVYIIYAELIDLGGKVKHYKRTAVLAVKL